jgi:hypothetical protein
MLRPKLMLFRQPAPNLLLVLFMLATSEVTGASLCGEAT